MLKLVICRPAHEVALFGGPASVEVRVGQWIRIHPACDLFMRGAKYAKVTAVREATLMVRPYIGGEPVKGRFVIRHEDVLVDEHGLIREGSPVGY